MNFNQSIAAAQTPISASLGTAAGEATAHSPVANADASASDTSVSAAAQIEKALEFASGTLKGRFALKIANRDVKQLDEATATKALAWLKVEIDKEAT